MPNITNINGVAVADISFIDGIAKASISSLSGFDLEAGVHVWLLAGQSNMVGRADFDGGEGYPDGTLQYPQPTGYNSGYTDTTTIAASPPLQHWDERAGDMGLALQFSIDYVAQTGAQVVLIPAADGGTGFAANHWNPGNAQYEHAVNATNALMAANPSWSFRGVLWHQGESDANNVNFYKQFYRAVQQMRVDIDVADESTPWVLGQLFVGGTATNYNNSKVLNATKTFVPNTSLVTVENLTSYDNLHFDAASLRVLGQRYLAQIPNAQGNVRPAAESGAIAHYLFGADNQLFTDLTGSAPAVTGTASDFEYGYVVTQSPPNGLDTNISEPINITMAAVFRYTGENDFLMGNLDPNVSGFSIFTVGDGLWFNERNGVDTQNIVTLPTSTPIGTMLFVAVSIDADDNYVGYFNAEGYSKSVISGTGSGRNTSVNPIAIGDIYFNRPSFAGQAEIAEAIIFDSALTEAQLDTVYANSVSRMSDREMRIGSQSPSFVMAVDLELGDGQPTFTLPFADASPTRSYDCTVYWGDGSSDVITSFNDSAVTHTYAALGFYRITIAGAIGDFSFNNAGDRLKVVGIESYSNDFFTLGNAFYGCANLDTYSVGLSLPPNAGISFDGMFRNTDFDRDISNWNISQLTSAVDMFTNSGLTTLNYDSLLIGWASQAPNIQTGVTLSDIPCQYSPSAQAARDVLVNTYSWNISDQGSSVVIEPTQFTIDTRNVDTDSTASNQYAVQLYQFSGAIDGRVDWGDGTSDAITDVADPRLVHTYATEGVYQISITCTDPAVTLTTNLVFGDSSNGAVYNESKKLISIDSFANCTWSGAQPVETFNKTSNLVSMPSDGPVNMIFVASMFRDSSGLSDFNMDAYTVSGGSGTRAFQGTTMTTGVNFSWAPDDLFATFISSSNFNGLVDNWDVSNVSNFTYVFASASSFNQPLSSWDTANAGSFFRSFDDASSFNQDLGSWNVSSATNFSFMFFNASAYNNGGVGGVGLGIDQWNTQSVTNFRSMFQGASAFSQYIGSWNMSSATSLSQMFYEHQTYNEDLSGWERTTPDVSSMSNVTTTSDMFLGARDFNQPIGNWNTSSLTSCSRMFYSAKAFNQDLGGWTMTGVTSLFQLFYLTDAFNNGSVGGIGAGLDQWDVSNVTNFAEAFNNALAFNQYIGSWDTSSATSMSRMFNGNPVFNQDISGWNVSNVSTMVGMFFTASSFDQDLSNWTLSSLTDISNGFNGSAMSDANAEDTLYGWSLNPLTATGVEAANIMGTNRTYAAGSPMDLALNDPTNGLVAAKGWTVTGITIV